jgi:hypothetical protein
MEKNVFKELISLIYRNGGYFEDYKYNFLVLDDEVRVYLSTPDGKLNYVISKDCENYQTITLADGISDVPVEVMEVANAMRQLNANGELDRFRDMINQ